MNEPRDICHVCFVPFPEDPLDPRRYIDVCKPCGVAAETFNKLSRENADSEYAYHELAHHVLLNGFPHRTFLDCYVMQAWIDGLPMGRSQVHEMRTLALQGTAYMLLGWEVNWSNFVERSWWGLKDVTTDLRRGAPVVSTYLEALQYVQWWTPHVSKKKANVLAKAIKRLRNGSI